MKCALQQDVIIKIYPYSNMIPSVLNFLITAMSFGIIGSLERL